MGEAEKTKEQLMHELATLRQRLAQLEAAGMARQDVEAPSRQTPESERLGTLPLILIREFNNAMTAVLGYIELALYDVSPDSVTWRRLQQALAAGRRVEELTQQLFTIGRHLEQQHRPT